VILKGVKLVASIHKAQLAIVLSSINQRDALFEKHLDRLFSREDAKAWAGRSA